jgi:hypothetical protein
MQQSSIRRPGLVRQSWDSATWIHGPLASVMGKRSASPGQGPSALSIPRVVDVISAYWMTPLGVTRKWTPLGLNVCAEIGSPHCGVPTSHWNLGSGVVRYASYCSTPMFWRTCRTTACGIGAPL